MFVGNDKIYVELFIMLTVVKQHSGKKLTFYSSNVYFAGPDIFDLYDYKPMFSRNSLAINSIKILNPCMARAEKRKFCTTVTPEVTILL